MKARARMLVLAGMLMCVACVAMTAPAAAQNAMPGMDMPSMPAMPHANKLPKHDQHAKHIAAPTAAKPFEPQLAQHGIHMHAMQRDATPLAARSPDYSDGFDDGSMPGMDMHDDPAFGMLRLDRLEYTHTRAGVAGASIDGEAWYGRNLDKLWLKFEGERTDGRMQSMRVEVLWDHAVTSFWDSQLGVRHDSGGGPGRSWLAVGIEGVAPWWVETQATFYVGQNGRTAARVAFAYEARFTQRLILQPSLEANLYGRDDPQRGLGSGLSDVRFGLRLRYEIRREFAPYVGLVWQQRFGRTRDYVRARGESVNELQFVAGLRLWF